VGGFFGGRIAKAFDVDTVCESVVIGLASFSNPEVCSFPASVAFDAWSEPNFQDPESGTVVPNQAPPSLTVALFSDAISEDFHGDEMARVLKFAASRTYKAGEPVFVAVQMEKAMCVAGTLPACDTTASRRFRPSSPGAGWAPMSQPKSAVGAQVPPVAEQLIFGVTDCSPAP
jgi:hypothetical protein